MDVEVFGPALLVEMRKAVAFLGRGLKPQEQEDLVQEACRRVLEAVQRRTDRQQPIRKAYLHKTAYSALVDLVRRRALRPEVPLNSEIESTIPASGPDFTSDPDPETALQNAELGSAIQDCLLSLRPDRRQAVTLHLMGYASTAIAERLGWARKKADNLVTRGKADLRRCLAEKGLHP